MSFRPGTVDIITMRSIFREGAYDTSWSGQEPAITAWYHRIIADGRRPLIVDAGANIGAASAWFSTRYPAAKVVSIEPDPVNASLCRSNTTGNVIEGAVGAECGLVTIESARNNSNDSFRTVRDDSGNARIITIPEILDANPECELFLVKVDIEGFESDLFASNTGWVDDTKVLFIELHDWMLPGQGTSGTFQRRIGTGEFEMATVGGGNLLYVRRP